MDLFNLVARLGLDTSAYEKGVGGAMTKGVLLGNLMTDLVKKGAGLATGLVKTGLTYNQQMEDYTTNFKVMLGSLTAAESKVEELKTMAAKTPFAMEDLAGATQTLLAFGVQSSKTTDVMSKLGDISLGNAQRFASLSNAYGKAAAQGKLTGEVVQMMVDAGFNPLLQISEATGESMEKLQKRMSAGKVSVDELDLALRRATGEGGQFYKGMEEASKTMSGQLSTLEDNWNSFLGESMSPVSEQLSSKILPKAIESLDKLSAALFGVKDDADGAKKALFLNSAGEEIDPSANLLTWVQDLMTEWTNGETEDAETVQSFVASFNENSNAIKDALIARIDDMSNPMTPEEMEEAKAKIAEITAMQGEVETLLQKRAGGYITEDEETRLNAIIATLQTMQTEIEGAAGFDENIVTPWERFISALGDTSAGFLTQVADFLVWCADNGETVGTALGLVAAGLTAVWAAAHPIAATFMLAVGAGVLLVANLDKIKAAANDAADALDRVQAAEKYGYGTGEAGARSAVSGGYSQGPRGGATEQSGQYSSLADMMRGNKHAVGLDYVPYDEYPALLHEGEAVLTKAEARAWRNGEDSAPAGMDYGRMASAFVTALSQAGLAFNVNGRTLAYATVGDNARAGSDRARDINIGRVR